MDDEESYGGPVTVVIGAEEFTVPAHLAGNFDPLNGEYRWRGRLSAHAGITERFEDGHRRVVLRSPDGHEATGSLNEPDLWGGHPVSGAGRPPFAVPEVRPDADG